MAGAPSSAGVLWSLGLGFNSYTAVTIMSRRLPVPSPRNPTYQISVDPSPWIGPDKSSSPREIGLNERSEVKRAVDDVSSTGTMRGV